VTKFENGWSIHTGEGLARKKPKPIGRRVTGQEGGRGIYKTGHYSPTWLWRWNRVLRNVGI